MQQIYMRTLQLKSIESQLPERIKTGSFDEIYHTWDTKRAQQKKFGNVGNDKIPSSTWSFRLSCFCNIIPRSQLVSLYLLARFDEIMVNNDFKRLVDFFHTQNALTMVQL